MYYKNERYINTQPSPFFTFIMFLMTHTYGHLLLPAIFHIYLVVSGHPKVTGLA